ncbi:CMGC family protein kinase [Histomonas meleagridis]|uniref:CMGC family protein kinase n=1 Tax=Histomonas meleagridis TaxID=135588 RepID=UPI00355A10BA|nr:CMGC family protein kinase [Histomonas meleagridis]KAH0806634.1 CMGC family protein kinase [Histomonas meleagridis]
MGSDFRIVAKLGEGSFAEVFKAKSTRFNQYVAIKRLKKRYRSLEEVNHLPEIVSLLQLQGHPNIVKLLDLIYDNQNGYFAMVFELLDCNVYEFITEHKKPFTENESLILIYQLLSAIAFMHSKNMFHRDVKPENCMVNRDTFLLKLVDFGSTRGVTSSTSPYTEYVSTRWYRAPECILTSGSYGPEVDEWAVGCMLYELLTTRPLFPGKHEIDQIARIHNLLGTPARDVLAQFRKNPNTQIPLSFQHKAPQDLHTLLPKCSQETIELLSRLLTYNPSERITAADALNLPAFAQIREYEAAWNQKEKTIPFSLYFLQNVNAVNSPPQPYPQITQPKEQPLPQPEQQEQQPIRQQYAPVIQQPPIAQPKPKLKPIVGNIPSQYSKQPIDPYIYQARLKAAQRVKQYQQKKMAQQMQASVYKKPVHGGAYQFSNQKYQKPRIDLIYPRLPKIVL